MYEKIRTRPTIAKLYAEKIMVCTFPLCFLLSAVSLPPSSLISLGVFMTERATPHGRGNQADQG